MSTVSEKVGLEDPQALEDGRLDEAAANGKKNAADKKHVHHHHHHHNPAKKVKHSLHHAREKRKRRETQRLRGKLPGVMYSEEDDIKRLKKRLVLKNEIIAAAAEFCGTFLFLFFSFGIATQAGQQGLSNSTSTQTATTGSASSLDTSSLLYSSLGFGFSLAVNAWVFFRVSGGLFNPAVTLGLFLCGALTWYRSIILTIVQFVGAIAAAGIAQLVVPGGINARTELGAATTLAQGFFIEMFCTAMLMFAIYMLAGEKHKATFLAPVGIGLALFLCELFATGLTGGSLNPARTLGPDVIAAKFDTSTWIYYTAPFVGTGLSALVYWLLKVSRYETANEGQDDDETEQALILRDTSGNITGAVQRIDLDQAADIPGLPSLPGITGANRSSVSLAAGGESTATGSHAAIPGLDTAPGTRAPSIIDVAAASGPIDLDRVSHYRPSGDDFLAPPGIGAEDSAASPRLSIDQQISARRASDVNQEKVQETRDAGSGTKDFS